MALLQRTLHGTESFCHSTNHNLSEILDFYITGIYMSSWSLQCKNFRYIWMWLSQSTLVSMPSRSLQGNNFITCMNLTHINNETFVKCEQYSEWERYFSQRQPMFQNVVDTLLVSEWLHVIYMRCTDLLGKKKGELKQDMCLLKDGQVCIFVDHLDLGSNTFCLMVFMHISLQSTVAISE